MKDRMTRLNVRMLGLVTCLAVLPSSLVMAKDWVFMEVQAYSDRDNPPNGLRRFATVSLGKTENELLEKELLFLVRERLVARGLVHDPDNPELLVGLVGHIAKGQKYIPPSTFYWPVPVGGTTTTYTTGAIGNLPVRGTSTSTTTGTQMVPVSRNGYEVTEYDRAIQIVVSRIGRTETGSAVATVWSGTVQSEGRVSDLLTVAPTMIDQLLGEFPQRSGKPPSRKVEIKLPKTKK